MRTLLALFLVAVPFGAAESGERFACNMNALSKAERERYQEVTKQLFAAVEKREELKDGYAFRLPSASLLAAAEWISLERRCCPFFAFDLEQTKDSGPLWLRVRGAEGVKAFIRAELDL